MKETAKSAPEQTLVLSPGIPVSSRLAGHLALSLHLSSQLSGEVVKCYPLLLRNGSGGASASMCEGSWSPSSGCSSRRAGSHGTPTQAGCPCEHQTSSFSEQQSPTTRRKAWKMMRLNSLQNSSWGPSSGLHLYLQISNGARNQAEANLPAECGFSTLGSSLAPLSNYLLQSQEATRITQLPAISSLHPQKN